MSWRAVPLVGVPIAALLLAVGLRTTLALDIVLLAAGCGWTVIEVVMGFIIGPSLHRSKGSARADIVLRLIPTRLLLMPTIAAVTIVAAVLLAHSLGDFGLGLFSNPFVMPFAAIAAGQGVGVFLPNDLRIALEMRKGRPNVAKIGRLGLQNARLAGNHAAVGAAILFVIAWISAGVVGL